LSYPGFQCPICRTYSDLEASVAIETDEVMEKYNHQNRNTVIMDDNSTNAPPADSGLGLQSLPSLSSDIQVQSPLEISSDDDNQPLSEIDVNSSIIPPPLSVSNTYSTTFESPVNYSEITPDLSPLDNHHDLGNK
jgi:hypothetical protein